MSSIAQQLNTVMQKTSGKTAYCIIDSVRASQQNENWRNAFYTDAAPFCILGHPAEIATHASILPWLGQVLPGKAVHKFLSAQAGESIGLLLYADSDLARIARVFLPLRYACLPDGDTAWFRFYDPRVFTAFFSVAEADQKCMFFKNTISAYFAEDIIHEKITSYHNIEDYQKCKAQNIVKITPSQKETFDEMYFKNIVFEIFKDIKNLEQYGKRRHFCSFEDVCTCAEWGYAQGVTDSHELHILVRILLKRPWSAELAAVLEQKSALLPEVNPAARRKYICAHRCKLGDCHE